MKTIAQEITGNVHGNWPTKGLFTLSSLSVKYVILYKIGIANWAPINHGSRITPSLESLIYQIGTIVAFDFGECVFEKILEQVESFVVKMPIAFSSLITGILVK